MVLTKYDYYMYVVKFNPQDTLIWEVAVPMEMKRVHLVKATITITTLEIYH